MNQNISSPVKSLLRLVFDKMEHIGWSLNDFEKSYKAHKNFLSTVCEKFNNGEIEENELVWCAQFVSDFLDCLENLDADAQIKTLKINMEEKQI